jgi:Ca2+-binding RTX toxin-like protein
MAMIPFTFPGFGITWDGTPRNDSKSGTAYNDSMFGLGGNDTLHGLGGIDIIDGGDGNDRIFGGAGNDNLYGGAGKNYIDGGAGKDTIFFDVSDTVVTGAGRDLLNFQMSFQVPGETSPPFATIMDFNPDKGDTLALRGWGAKWKNRDIGVDDGFEIKKLHGDVWVHVKTAGAEATIILKHVAMSHISADDFLFA